MIIQQLRRTEIVVVPHPGTNKVQKNKQRKLIEKQLPQFNKRMAFLQKEHAKLDAALQAQPSDESLQEKIKDIVAKIVVCKQAMERIIG